MQGKKKFLHTQKHPVELFYKKVSLVKNREHFFVFLDDKRVSTPAGSPMILPTKGLADLVAVEFRLQRGVVNMAEMPVTRLINTVIDEIIHNTQQVIEDLSRFSSTDMLLYRATEDSNDFFLLQVEKWDPLLDLIQELIESSFIVSRGVMPISQRLETLDSINLYLRRFHSPYALAALHSMTTLTGSILISLLVSAAKINMYEAWRLAQLEEDWNVKYWGEDAEARKRRNVREKEFVAATTVLIETLNLNRM